MLRHLQNLLSGVRLARRRGDPLPVSLYRHNSLIRRRLGEVDPVLQDNKAVNLGLAAPRVDGVLIAPGETFSLWRLVGPCTAAKGYRTGLIIKRGQPDAGLGGGLCQLTNLIHWMVLHTPMTITEHHHHDDVDLFPDFGRQVPFGTGTSILYNYLDYRFRNDTDQTIQLLVRTTEEHLCGELRAERPLPVRYHVKVEGECFTREGKAIYRNGQIFRDCVDARTGIRISRELVKANHARVMYPADGLTVVEVRR